MNKTRADQKLAVVLSWVIGFIFVILPFHAILTTWIGSNIGHLDLLRIWKEILIAAMVPPALWLAFRRPGLKAWLGRSWIARLIYIYAMLTFGLGFWALAHHQVNRVALIYALLINLRFFGFFMVCLVVGAYSDWLARRWVKLVLWPAVLVIIAGLVQKFFLPYDFLRHLGYGPKTIPAYQTVDANIDYRRIQSTLRGANPLGVYLSFVTPATVLTLRPMLKKLIFLLAALIVLFYSYSRSAWIGTGLALVVISWYAFQKRISSRWLVVAVILLALIGGGLYAFRSDRSLQDTLFHTSSSSHSALSSNAQRLRAIKSGIHDVVHQPLGRGPGTAGPASFRNNHPPRIAENYYLQMGQEVGIGGLVLFVIINYLVAVELWRQRRQSLHLLLLAALVSVSAIGLVSHAWADDVISLLWWGLAGVALSASMFKGTGSGRIQKPS